MTKVRKLRWENQATRSLPPQAQGSFPAGEEVCLAEDRVSVRPQDRGGPLVCVGAPLLSWVPGLGVGTQVMLCLWGLAGPAAWSHASQCEIEEMYSWSRVFWSMYLQTCTPHCWESPPGEANSIVASAPQEVLEQSQETLLAAKSAMTFPDVLLKGLPWSRRWKPNFG